MKRIFLFILTNIAVILAINIVVSVFGVNKFLHANGLNLPMLLAFSLIVGFTGSFISLFMSKWMAKFSMGVQIIKQPSNATEVWLMQTVQNFATRAGIAMPEVGIFEGEPNAFATGPSKNNSLVAVSTGLLQTMNQKQVEAVIGHEIAHVANGDMVTLTLVQGVVNTFVVFLSRVAAFAVDKLISKQEDNNGPGVVYFVVSIVFEIIFGIFASIVVKYVSRKREFAADAGAVKLMGTNTHMIGALQVLQSMQNPGLPPSMAASGIAGASTSKFMRLFMTHPPLEERIAALQAK